MSTLKKAGEYRFDTAGWKHSDFLQYEWLETTGTGAYACSTICGDNTRRYHGVLVAGDGPDDHRQVLLARLDETLICGEEAFELSSRSFIHDQTPEGFSYLKSFSRGVFPEFVFEVPVYDGQVAAVRKTIVAVHGENRVVLVYELTGDIPSVPLVLEPFIALRPHHSLRGEDCSSEFESRFQQSALHVSKPGGRGVRLQAPGGVFVDDPVWYHEFLYTVEKERGYDFLESLFLPGKIEVQLKKGELLCLTVSADDGSGAGTVPSETVEKERARREELLQRAGVKTREEAHLVWAADQFLVRHPGGELDIIAGYPWFTCWGRDTMISLPGICLATGRAEEAREVLQGWLDRVQQGLIPNRLTGEGDQIHYNTVDATLWLVVSVYHYITHTQDWSLVDEGGYQTLCEVIDWHISGTLNGIVIDSADGLLRAGDENTQLTWMDAWFEGTAITPRDGKPVEVNALWYNALKILSGFARQLGESDAKTRFDEQARHCRESFEQAFWLEEQGYLADCIRDHELDRSLRPNQLFAISLPFPLLKKDHARKVISAIREELLTPVGLRTLAPSDAAYQGRYRGDLGHRDRAYHQGTVWPWLLGPYLTAVLRYEGRRGAKEVRALIESLSAELVNGGVGSLSEVYDGDTPHRPSGCFAQAWSVAELLRVQAGIGVQAGE